MPINMRPYDSEDPYRLSYITDEDQSKQDIEMVKKNLTNVREGLSGVDKMLKYSLISNICFFVITVLVIIFAPFATAAKQSKLSTGGNPAGVPIGTITAWTMKMEVGGAEVEDIPAGWQRCDGSTIQPPSIWAGQKTPDLNNARRFIRGGRDGDVLKTEEDAVKTLTTIDEYYHIGSDSEATCPSTGSSYGTCKGGSNGCSADKYCTKTRTIEGTGGAETKPKNINLVYIIRVW